MNKPSRRIVLTGFMGAGKTTIAKALAFLLNCRMIDLDEFIAEREGRTVTSIIDENGESRFREIESSALVDALQDKDAHVIALGGGTWTLEQNRALFSDPGNFTVWLDTPFELCWKRITNEGKRRPLARDHARAQQLYAARRLDYEHANLHVIVNENGDVEETVTRIEKALLESETDGRRGYRC